AVRLSADGVLCPRAGRAANGMAAGFCRAPHYVATCLVTGVLAPYNIGREDTPGWCSGSSPLEEIEMESSLKETMLRRLVHTRHRTLRLVLVTALLAVPGAHLLRSAMSGAAPGRSGSPAAVWRTSAAMPAGLAAAVRRVVRPAARAAVPPQQAAGAYPQ